jgi:hypothetical protein
MRSTNVLLFLASIILLYWGPKIWFKMAGKHALIVPALKKQTATVIMAHGLGDRWASSVLLDRER